MSNNKLICFRVDDELKERIEKTANESGQSVTTFIKESVMATVARLELSSKRKNLEEAKQKHRQSVAHQAIIQWLLDLCNEATKGGSLGFREVGERFSWTLHFRFNTECNPNGEPCDDWGKILKGFDGLLVRAKRTDPQSLLSDEAYNDSVWDKFTQHFSDAAKLIPARRIHQFLLGVYGEVWKRGKGKLA